MSRHAVVIDVTDFQEPYPVWSRRSGLPLDSDKVSPGCGGHRQPAADGVWTWLLGYVCLVLNMRSEREALFRPGFFSNRWMIYWAAAAAIFVKIVTFVSGVQVALKLGCVIIQERRKSR